MTTTMKAGTASASGLTIIEVARPQPGEHQVLVRVSAAGINRADLNAAKGTGVASADAYGKPIGMEWAGEVVEVGQNVSGIRVGDAVMCSGTGGYAEYAVTDQGRVMPVPEGMSMEQAAVLPLALLTAHDALITNGQLKAGESVLVQGASSAVGLMSLQIARLKGANVIIGTSTNEDRRGQLYPFGATLVLDPRSADWSDEVLRATDGGGVNVTIDMVSGAAINAGMRCSALRGRIVNVGRLGGTSADFNFDLHAARRLNYIGVTFRTRSLQEIRDIVSRMRDDLWDAVSDGTLSLPIDKSYALDDAVAAHARMRANEHFGKLVLLP